MKALTRREQRWNPFQEMEELQNHLSSLLRLPMFGTRGQEGGEHLTSVEWMPLADIVEEDKEYIIKAELPGLQKEDLKVTVEQGVLTISGERKFEKEEKRQKYHRVERSYGSFVRSFTLPQDVDPGKINAEFKNGILEVHVAKDANAKPKAIEVKVS